MANFLRDMIKDIIREELSAPAPVEAPAPSTTPQEPQEGASNSVEDKNTTPSEDTPKQALQSVTETFDREAFNVELRKMIKSEVGGAMADVLNSTPATPTNAVNVDNVYAKLLGFPTN